MASHESIVMEYARSTVDNPLCCTDTRAAARRFLNDLNSGRWDWRPEEAEFIVLTIENLFCHAKGEAIDGSPLRGSPFVLQPWELFCIYNIFGFYLPGTQIRRFLEAFHMLPRKSGKTPYATATCWGAGLKYAKSNSIIKTVAGSIKQNMEGFGFLSYNLHRLGLTVHEDPIHGLRVLDSSLGHSFSGAIWDGHISYDALAYKPDLFDAFNANIILLDELELYRNATPYTRLGDAGKAYRNKLLMMITTAGDKGSGFCAQHMTYCSRIARGEITGPDADRIFSFIARADPDPETGKVDYLSPVAWQQANPSWGVTISPADMEAAAMKAQNNPQTRTEFYTRSLNVFVNSLSAYFSTEEFIASDLRYNFTQEQLTKLVPAWYGGADLSRLHDLTAGCIVGEIPAAKAASNGWTPPEDVLVVIPHCWFPVTAAVAKAQEDEIPLFGWQDDGWLDMPNSASMNHTEPVAQFAKWRKAGFKIKKVGHDRKFARPYVAAMKKAKFTVVDQPQLAVAKSEGFRYIQHKAKVGCLYYCHAEPFLYCVGNVKALKDDEIVIYEKIEENKRIDVFDAAVFASIRFLIDTEKVKNADKWYKTSNVSNSDTE